MNYIVNDFYNNGYENKYVRNIICKFMCDSGYNRDTVEVKGNIVILYDQETSERIRRIVVRYGIQTDFHFCNVIGKLICKTSGEISK